MAEKIIETVVLPQGVSAELNGSDIKVRGNGKENSGHFRTVGVYLMINGQNIEVWSGSERRNIVAQAKTIASHLNNLITGLDKTYECRLEIVYSHFPINVSVKDKFVEINNLAGAKHPKRAMIVGNSRVEVKGKDVVVKGSNKEHVGQTAANMEQVSRVKGKDIRVFQDRVYIVSKVKAV